MSAQKVFHLPKRESYKDLVVVDEPIPEPHSSEVLVKIKAISLNFRDQVIANGKYPLPAKENVIPCSDASGEVAEVGDRAEGFEKGDHVVINFDQVNLYGAQKVWFHGHGGPIDGMLREYVAVPATALVKLPKDSSLTWAQWACLPCTGVTAWNSLYGNIPLKPGQTVLFQGTGGVSITGLLLAKAAGAVTIVTSSSDDKLKTVKEKFGADFTINYKKTPNWADEALKITNGEGVDYILENGGSGTIKQSVDCIKMGGIISVIGFLSPAPQDQMPDAAMLPLMKGCVIRGINVGPKSMLEDVVRIVTAHKIQLPVDKVFGFSHQEVLDAYAYLASQQHIGKVCISVSA